MSITTPNSDREHRRLRTEVIADGVIAAYIREISDRHPGAPAPVERATGSSDGWPRTGLPASPPLAFAGPGGGVGAVERVERGHVLV